MGDWTIFSNYGHVLVCLARDRQARLRDVAREVGVTERAVQKIVRDLQDAGYLTVTKQGRCNRYRINNRKSLRHGLLAHCTVGKLLSLLAAPTGRADAEAPASEKTASKTVAAVKPAPPPTKPDDAPKAKAAPEKSKEKRNVPVDTRQQGSLF